VSPIIFGLALHFTSPKKSRLGRSSLTRFRDAREHAIPSHEKVAPAQIEAISEWARRGESVRILKSIRQPTLVGTWQELITLRDPSIRSSTAAAQDPLSRRNHGSQ